MARNQGIALMIFTLLSFFSSDVIGAKKNQSIPHAQYAVSMVDLIVRPEQFTHWDSSIQVAGFLAKHANLYLFLTKAHAKIYDMTSAIPFSLGDSDISLENSSCVGQFVSVIGRIKKDPDGELVISHVIQVRASGKGWGLLPCWTAPE